MESESKNVFGVIGSRSFNNYELLKETLNQYNIGFIVSGAAPGADSLAIEYAKEKSIPYKEFPADWNNINVEPCVVKYNKQGNPYNALAGFNRNQTIVDHSNYIIAFTNGSKGTADSIDKAKNKGIPVNVINF